MKKAVISFILIASSFASAQFNFAEHCRKAYGVETVTEEIKIMESDLQNQPQLSVTRVGLALRRARNLISHSNKNVVVVDTSQLHFQTASEIAEGVTENYREDAPRGANNQPLVHDLKYSEDAYRDVLNTSAFRIEQQYVRLSVGRNQMADIYSDFRERHPGLRKPTEAEPLIIEDLYKAVQIHRTLYPEVPIILTNYIPRLITAGNDPVYYLIKYLGEQSHQTNAVPFIVVTSMNPFPPQKGVQRLQVLPTSGAVRN